DDFFEAEIVLERVPKEQEVASAEDRAGSFWSCGTLNSILARLVAGLADFAQEGPPGRGVDLIEQVFRYDLAESRVLVSDRFIEPLERFVGIAAERIDERDGNTRAPPSPVGNPL